MTTVLSSVRLSGLERAIQKLTKIKGVLDSKEFEDELSFAKMRSRFLWNRNIYRWFDTRKSMGFDTTGQLGTSLVITGTHKSVMFKMADIYHNGKEYGELLRNGFGPSLGEYKPILDRRVKHGTHPGYDGRAWMKWIKWFRENNKSLYINATDNAVRRLS